MEQRDWVPEGVDVNRPSSARMYDYFLGGSHNFASDRALAAQLNEMAPNIGDTMRSNRHFLRRAIRYLVDQGVRQFLDLGSGIPTAGNVHEVAQEADPHATVVYVDIDPVAVAHSQRMLDDNDRTVAVHADVCAAEQILDIDEVRDLIDLEQPVGVLLAGVLHFVANDDHPHDIVARLRDAVVPGSHVVISHSSLDGQPPVVSDALEVTNNSGFNMMELRSGAEIQRMFDGWTLLEPGLVRLPFWRPEDVADIDEHAERSVAFGGVGRKDA